MATSDSVPRRFGDLAPSAYPGERLGLPAAGPRSVARLGRRIAALVIDWALATGLAFVIFGFNPWATVGVAPDGRSWLPLATFVVLQVVFIPTIGGSIGHRLLGLRLVPLAGGWIGVWRPLLRTALLAIVVPALVWDSDQRGFHDKVAGTVLIRM